MEIHRTGTGAFSTERPSRDLALWVETVGRCRTAVRRPVPDGREAAGAGRP
ncbi:hypothetical protein Srubr_43870 [Streptomyces rubradiris]|uniref:Uncharacterized protein n=1 Tax=Streptomyces rubradiris TaxID=285531 RepID=A0ABQ3RFB9_STRRR|nr:hypothetical protein GCM10018792_08410 [Streptomyces rubradiris]GHI54541.1 hypothetical protein Srubr_43870 [Streptomyces rubradiris]